ncbi:DUF4136 domain-containing protein [Shewanella decolorationis]|uniref:DUF4136 domain-containing protein n=1 Tax=Shewanella decolorationis S12 TaxID=1353536 RepID=A0ABP2Z2R7_9GAMM|nr:DUF4136 domain-containing protein [Shewanella decolorationis]ESE40913.1 hypothetical protein SHD_2470 [Shewanella decolorationis S12]GLR30812.1 hypothetical protein GCM10007922_03690 [Shewanella decolorationis]
MNLTQTIWRVMTLLTFGLVGLTACVTVEDSQALRTTVVTSGDLSQLPPSAMTYTWHPTLQKIFVDRRLDKQQVLQHMQDTLKKVLLTKGFRWVEDPQLADFQVGFGVAMGTQMSDDQILAAAGLVPGLSNQGVDLKKYDKGSVLISFFKPTGIAGQPYEIIWRVLGQGFANIKDMDELKARFDSSIEEMLLSLPATHAVQ